MNDGMYRAIVKERYDERQIRKGHRDDWYCEWMNVRLRMNLPKFYKFSGGREIWLTSVLGRGSPPLWECFLCFFIYILSIYKKRYWDLSSFTFWVWPLKHSFFVPTCLIYKKKDLELTMTVHNSYEIRSRCYFGVTTLCTMFQNFYLSWPFTYSRSHRLLVLVTEDLHTKYEVQQSSKYCAWYGASHKHRCTPQKGTLQWFIFPWPRNKSCYQMASGTFDE